MGLSSYKELIVWQKSIDLVEEIYTLTKAFPKEEIYGLTSQMRRAAVSIPSNIAEGFARKTKKDNAHFVQIAFASASELETQLIIASRLRYTTAEKSGKADKLLLEILKMLNSLLNKLRN